MGTVLQNRIHVTSPVPSTASCSSHLVLFVKTASRVMSLAGNQVAEYAVYST